GTVLDARPVVVLHHDEEHRVDGAGTGAGSRPRGRGGRARGDRGGGRARAGAACRHALERDLVDVHSRRLVARLGRDADRAGLHLLAIPLGPDLDVDERAAGRLRLGDPEPPRAAVAGRPYGLLGRRRHAAGLVAAQLEAEGADLAARDLAERAPVGHVAAVVVDLDQALVPRAILSSE